MTALSVPVRLIGARCRLVIVGTVVRRHERIADMAPGRPAGAVIAALLTHSCSASMLVAYGSYTTVALCAAGFASTEITPGRRPTTRSTTAFSAA